MKKNRKILSVLVFATLLLMFATPATATDNKLLLDPIDSSGSGNGSCVNIDIYSDINEVDEAMSTQFDIEYDPSCIAYPPTFVTAPDWETVTFSTASGVCYFTTTVGLTPPISGHRKIGTLTVCCDSDCCGSFLNFTNAKYRDGLNQLIYPALDNGTLVCGKPVEVTKKIFNESSSNWEDYLQFNSTMLDKDVTFQITVDANCLDLSNVVLIDVLDPGLIYNNSASTPPNDVTGQTLTWNIGTMSGSSSLTYTFDATINSYGELDNNATATATVDLLGVGVSDSDQATEKTMPPAGLEVNKTVWDPDAEAWVETITAVVDYVDIGNDTSEATHNINGFGPIEPATHGGGWGAPADGTCRVIWTDVAPDDGGRSASFTMDNPYLNADLLQISVLNGIANDDFDVFVNGDYMYTYIHDPDTTERWVTHSIDVSAYSDQPVLTIELNATGPAWGSFVPYGQVAVSWAKLYRNSPVIGDTFRFRCEVHNTGSPGMDLSNLEVWDVISPSLEYADSAMLMTPNGVWRSIEPPSSVTPYDPVDGTTVTWIIDDFLQDPLTLIPCNTFVVEYDVNVIDYGLDCNVQYAKGYCDIAFMYVENNDDACIDTRYPDLSVIAITVNDDLPSIRNHAFAHNTNSISAVIKEINGVAVADTFYVKFEVDGIEKCTVTVDGIGALEEKKVWCEGSWTPDSIGTVTITVTADSTSVIDEASETNNALDKSQDVVYCGYKGNGHQDGRNISALQCHDQGTINLIYSVGDSQAISGSGSPNWTTSIVNWVPSDFNIPPTESCIKKARLYAYYTYDKSPDGDPTNTGDGYYFSMKFNGDDISLDQHYTDRKNYGSYDKPYGMIAYDVTDEFLINGNTGELTYTWPTDEYKSVSLTGMLLLVVYNNTQTEPDRIIWINEGYDILYAKDSYGVSSEEATTHATFEGCGPIPLSEVVGANLITVVPHGNDGDDMNRLFFNDGEWHGVWDSYTGGTELGIAETDVRSYLESDNNKASFQSHIPDGGDKGDYMEAANAFLVVEKGTGSIEVVAPEECVPLTEQFDVLINVTPVEPVYAVQYELSFDSDIVHVEWQNEGDFLSQGGASTNVYINDFDNVAGIVRFTVSRTGTQNGATDPGTLAIIHFTAVSSGVSDLTFTLVKASDVNTDPIPMHIFNGEVEVCTNVPPDAVAKCLFKYNNVGTKYLSKTFYDGSKSTDDGTITNYRWYFGDGNYGNGETYEHVYGSHLFSGGAYIPFTAILTVEDDGVPMMESDDLIPVNVYIAGDANGDGIVDVFDAATLGLEWDKTANFDGNLYWYDNERGDKADLNNDQIVDIFDAVIVGANWDHIA